MTSRIAIVGMACRYPAASSPVQLWEDVLAQRRAFRRIPAERLSPEYFDPSSESEDRTYSFEAAVIEGYEFDRLRFQVAGSTYRATDLAHWLALDVAAEALSDGGFDVKNGVNQESAGAIVGNTLTGEFSRANSLRLRWPYIAQALQRAAGKATLPPERVKELEASLEAEYKAPFAKVNEDTLAGGLSNTIAGRICNFLDWHGGGYTVDGACASSLLAVITACNNLQAGDLDFALAGGVDLSLDPFELVGFAKAGALARGEMRVYDERSSGFWPGEGCGFLALMREEDALREKRRIYASITGWGVSSDGSGGMTRPEVQGQLLAIQRAFRKAGVGADAAGYFEGHGTGTAVGDATELRALSLARQQAGAVMPVPIGSIKANIGHTKAAAGVAGLIKAVMAAYQGVLPPITGCSEPHPELKSNPRQLCVLQRPEPWPDRVRRAGVSAMGFGGINTHVVIESANSEVRREVTKTCSFQDAELFVFGADSRDELIQRVEGLHRIAARLSRSELTDLAADLARRVPALTDIRAAVVAGSPSELEHQLDTLRERAASGESAASIPGVFYAPERRAARIGFLFPGQGSPVRVDGGSWRWRFNAVDDLYRRNNFSAEQIQAAIVLSEIAAVHVLRQFGVTASTAIGHSLGELTALHYARSVDQPSVLRLAEARGAAMSHLPGPKGGMASLAAGPEDTRTLIGNEPVVIAGFNSPRQTTVSGQLEAVQRVMGNANARGTHAVELPVIHAFHSPLMQPAAGRLREALQQVTFAAPQCAVYSTVTGARLNAAADQRMLLLDQLTAPVQWTQALEQACHDVDLWIEVGPGHVLSGLCSDAGFVSSISVDSCGSSVRDLLCALGAAFAAGAPVQVRHLFEDRFTRLFPSEWQPRFFMNPCEAVPAALAETEAAPCIQSLGPTGETGTVLDTFRRLVAQRAELPLETVRDESRLLQDLHLNSILVAQIAGEAARALGLPPSSSPTEYADATVLEVASALEDRKLRGASASEPKYPQGCGTWVRAFEVALVEAGLPRHKPQLLPGEWRVFGSAPSDPPRVGGGVMVFAPPDDDRTLIPVLLDAAASARSGSVAPRFVLVQHGGAAAAFARTLRWEAPSVTTCVIDVPPGLANTMALVMAEVSAANGYAEAYYDRDGKRFERRLRPLPSDSLQNPAPLSAEDVLLVTGGGKGIAAECALALARETGIRLALIGRSVPTRDPVLAQNLDRMRGCGIAVKYLTADVSHAAGVVHAVDALESDLGPITAVLHGAGSNSPKLIAQLDAECFEHTLAPKVAGLANILEALDPDRLRLLIGLGSIIAQTGFHGEADYAFANERLARMLEQWQAGHPHCRCLAIESSIWSGVGMGERLGRADVLDAHGIVPITVDEGVRAVRDLVFRNSAPVRTVVTGRFGRPETLRYDAAEVPLLRFLEEPEVFYPGVEFIAAARLSSYNDPYLQDHVFRGVALFPAVLGLEAMLQAAAAVTQKEASSVVFQDVEFAHPISIPRSGEQRIRVAVLAQSDGEVRAVIRSEETGFAVDHFSARLRWMHDAAERESAPPRPAQPFWTDCANALYHRTLFQSGRFRRVNGYADISAKTCVAKIAERRPEDTWFGMYLPGRTLLSDPGARDATLHSVQACYPHAILLPARVRKITVFDGGSTGSRVVHARETARQDRALTFELTVTDEEGRVLERWEGVEYRVMESAPLPAEWPAALLAPFFERSLPRVFGREFRVQLRQAAAASAASANSSLRPAWHRPDGKPESGTNDGISVARSSGYEVISSGEGAVGCDLERAVARPWNNILAAERLILLEQLKGRANESETVAGTRIWCAMESLKKAGLPAQTPLMLNSVSSDGWVLLGSGTTAVATFAGRIQGCDDPLVFAWAAKDEHAPI